MLFNQIIIFTSTVSISLLCTVGGYITVKVEGSNGRGGGTGRDRDRERDRGDRDDRGGRSRYGI